MRRLREETQEGARRGEGRKTAPEGQGRAEGFEESRKSGEGRGKAQAKAEAAAERQVERRRAQRQASQWPWWKVHQGDISDIGDFREAQGEAGAGKQRFGLRRGRQRRRKGAVRPTGGPSPFRRPEWGQGRPRGEFVSCL